MNPSNTIGCRYTNLGMELKVLFDVSLWFGALVQLLVVPFVFVLKLLTLDALPVSRVVGKDGVSVANFYPYW